MAKISDTSTNQGMSTSAKHYKLIRGKEEKKKSSFNNILFYFPAQNPQRVLITTDLLKKCYMAMNSQ